MAVASSPEGISSDISYWLFRKRGLKVCPSELCYSHGETQQRAETFVNESRSQKV